MYVVASNVTFGFGTQTSCRILEIITLFPVYSFSCKSLSLNETGVLFSGTGRVKLILGVRKKKKKRMHYAAVLTLCTMFKVAFEELNVLKISRTIQVFSDP